MTTHDEQTDINTRPTADVDPSAQREPVSVETEPSASQADPLPTADAPPLETAPAEETAPADATPIEESAPAEESPTAGTESSDVRSESPAAEDSLTDKPLFADGTLSGLRSRWDDVQAAFVDDPKECVHKADALVAQVVEQLTTGFSDARSRLEAQWARGEDASTEDLRLALKRYREFFQRLLSA
jgi:hypothetical protein